MLHVAIFCPRRSMSSSGARENMQRPPHVSESSLILGGGHHARGPQARGEQDARRKAAGNRHAGLPGDRLQWQQSRSAIKQVNEDPQALRSSRLRVRSRRTTVPHPLRRSNRYGCSSPVMHRCRQTKILFLEAYQFPWWKQFKIAHTR